MSWHPDDVDTGLDSDSLNDFRQLVFAFNRRQVFPVAVTSLNTINLAVVADRDPFVST